MTMNVKLILSTLGLTIGLSNMAIAEDECKNGQHNYHAHFNFVEQVSKDQQAGKIVQAKTDYLLSFSKLEAFKNLKIISQDISFERDNYYSGGSNTRLNLNYSVTFNGSMESINFLERQTQIHHFSISISPCAPSEALISADCEASDSTNSEAPIQAEKKTTDSTEE
jgi:hypothetical protein